MQQAILHEQRRAIRVCSKGSIRVHHGAYLTWGRVVDLAVGGVRVRSETIALRAGEPVALALKLDASPVRSFALRGRVLRSTSPNGTFVIQFDDIPRELEDCLGEELSLAQQETHPRIVIIDPTAARRAAIASGLRTVGCLVTEVATPLEAIVTLGRLRFDPDVIAVATTEPGSVAEELCAFLRHDHPAAQVIAIGKPRERHDLHARVEQLLARRNSIERRVLVHGQPLRVA